VSPILIAILLGLIEGITEFLPVSSTGHLMLAGPWMRFSDEKAHAFEIFIQFGAILAVVWDLRAPIGSLLVRARTERAPRRFLGAVALAFLPAAIVGFALHKKIEEHLAFPRPIAWAFILGGVVILIVEAWAARRDKDARTTDVVEAVSWGQALTIGCAQVLALIPGASRSASTILGGLLAGLSRRAATEFSFYLAIPTLAAASGYALLKELRHLSIGDFPLFAIGFLVSFLAAAAVVRVFLAYVRTRTLAPFAWYRIAVGALILALVATGRWIV